VPGVDLPVELQDLRLELAEQRAQGFKTPSRHLRNAFVFLIGNGVEQFLHAVASNRSDNAELGEMRADRVDDRSLLPDDEMPRSM
jgi:hypothetical protein